MMEMTVAAMVDGLLKLLEMPGGQPQGSYR